MDFVRSTPPFDRLPRAAIEKVAAALETTYVPRGGRILERRGAPSAFLYVLRKGSVLLSREGQPLEVLESGDLFGFPSMIARASPTADVVAEDDALVYRIPEAVFRELMEIPAFAEFFVVGLAGRLRRTASMEARPLAGGLTAAVGGLVRRPPLSVPATATVREAAERMTTLRVSCLLVDGEPAGIVTDRDLRSRVLARGLGPDVPVDAVASRPLRSLDASATLFEALVFMLEHRVHHLPLRHEGEIVGVVSDTDLLRAQVKTPIYLLARLERLDALPELPLYGAEVAAMVDALFASGLEVAQIARVVSSLNDALTARLLRQAEAELGAPPCAYAWIVFGSEGRMEQALLTDQDNGLVFAEDSPEARDYFGRLASTVVERLVEAGFPRCKGGFMATRWCHPLAEWLRIFRGWTEQPTPQHLIEAASVFDFRAVHGALDLHPIEAVLKAAGDRRVFLAQLTRATSELKPPLGLFHRIVEGQAGVDLKAGGIVPLVSLARIAALEAKVGARPTLERFALAHGAGVIAKDTAETLSEAFRFLLRVRLREQLRTLRERGAPSNCAPLERLSLLERRHLKESFLAVREAQMAAAMRYQTDQLG